MNARTSIHLLLVEDSPGDARLVVEAFRDAAVESCLQWVKGVDAALVRLQEGATGLRPPIDLVILDLKLPCKDGRQLLADLRSDPQWRALHIAVLTTSASPEDRRWVAQFEHASFHTKPMEWTAWVDWARRVTEIQGSRHAHSLSPARFTDSHRLVG